MVEYLTMIPKIIEVLLFWILAYKIYKIHPSTLNKVYSIAFITWTFYTMADMVMWIKGADSSTWYIIVNIIRDIQMFAAIIFAFLIYLSTQIIVHGAKGLNNKKIAILAFIFIINAVLLVIVDKLYIYDSAGNLLLESQWQTADVVVVSPKITLLMSILFILPLYLYIQSIISLIKMINQKIKEKKLKKRMYNLIIGIALIPIGIIYFATVLGLPNLYNIFTITFGRIIWMLSPIFIWQSQKKKL